MRVYKYVCIYVYICVYMYVYMYEVYICVCMYIYIHNEAKKIKLQAILGQCISFDIS